MRESAVGLIGLEEVPRGSSGEEGREGEADAALTPGALGMGGAGRAEVGR